MKRLIALIIFMFIADLNAHNNTTVTEEDSISFVNRRIIFISTGVGFPEYLNVRIGYQLDNNWSAAVKLSNYYNGVGGRMYFGTLIGGVRITKYYEPTILYINNISFELGYSKSGNYNNYAFDLSIGNESTKNVLLKPFWALSISFIKTHDNKLYVTPGFKIGINFNF